MRLISPGADPPADVERYLIPGEREVIAVRKHPAVMLAPIVWAVIGLIIAAVLSDTLLRHDSGLTWIVWAIWGLVFLRLLWAASTWAVDYFIVTTNRFIETTGLLNRRVAMMPMKKVTDMAFERPFLGRILGYGTFILESAGQDQALSRVDFIPYPVQLYLEVCELMFEPDKNKDGGD
jgi:uncharacterized membrane protein YdbT with pleckstrin-like domain